MQRCTPCCSISGCLLLTALACAVWRRLASPALARPFPCTPHMRDSSCRLARMTDVSRLALHVLRGDELFGARASSSASATALPASPVADIPESFVVVTVRPPRAPSDAATAAMRPFATRSRASPRGAPPVYQLPCVVDLPKAAALAARVSIEVRRPSALGTKPAGSWHGSVQQLASLAAAAAAKAGADDVVRSCAPAHAPCCCCESLDLVQYCSVHASQSREQAVHTRGRSAGASSPAEG